MAKRYALATVPDNHDRLRATLLEIAADNGRVVNVIWEPQRETPEGPIGAGYTIIVEYEA